MSPHTQSRLLRHVRNSHYFHQMHHLAILPMKCRVLCSKHVLINTCNYLLLFSLYTLAGVICYLKMPSLVPHDVKHCFTCSLATCTLSMKKSLLKSLGYFQELSLLLSCKSCSCILGVSSLSDSIICCCLSVGIIFAFLMVFFNEQNSHF